ncbi:MAG: hypothetical protein J07AB43_00680 [Candidatus Nanosalina sp. J07AB43]|nr:MAG: hypothetical protein J07AB43_00680 [Candidatus Nanosalina sp. J07AB43]
MSSSNNSDDNDKSKQQAKKAKQSLNKVDEEVIKGKKDEIMKAVKKGNRGKARRHAVEIQQLLGNGDNELPIEDQLDELE